MFWLQKLAYKISSCHSGVFETHSYQCAVQTPVHRGKRKMRGFAKQQENRNENTFQAEQTPFRYNKGWDKTVYYLKSPILPLDREHRQQQRRSLNLMGHSRHFVSLSKRKETGSKPTMVVGLQTVGLSAQIWTEMR